MGKLYASPLRVYLVLAVLALAGFFSGFKLPISLFPNSSKPKIGVWFNLGNSTGEEFLNAHGKNLESQLRSISTDSVQVEKVTANYNSENGNLLVEFKWGASAQAALKEVETTVNSYAARLPEEIRNSIGVWTQNENTGFLAISFYSPIRQLDDLYEILEPVLIPQISKVQDAQSPELWNPTRKEIRVELNPEKMAALHLLPRDIDKAINAALGGYAGGSITMGTHQFSIQMPRQGQKIENLNQIIVPTPNAQLIHLGDIAKIDFGTKTDNTRSFKTNGARSLILFSNPKPGGNVKRMAEEMIEIVQKTMPSLPSDIQYSILVDPSEFIRGAVENVFHEVLIGALLAVGVLFLFIGSLRNVITAAIEIPLSMVLAFILMRMSGMTINLISLGGLALSAGMNVDGSVVVMENIFRHFEEAQKTHGGLAFDFKARLKIIVDAVSEVRFAVIASTIASLVVFLPLAFTSELSYAILGDLAKTVVFSHGFSAIVALILVPTVRLHLMSKGNEKPIHSPIETWIKRIENLYASSLGWFIKKRRFKAGTYLGLFGLLVILVALVLPQLPREIIGTPDTDWIGISVNTSGNTLLKQMESQVEETESQILDKFGEKIQYTFTNIHNVNGANIMARLKDKRQMWAVWKELETQFFDGPILKFNVWPWNPAELPIPDPPQMKIAIVGGDLKQRQRYTEALRVVFEENKVFPHLSTNPSVWRQENIVIRPNVEQWPMDPGLSILPPDLADIARVATNGRKVAELPINGRATGIFIRYPQSSVKSAEDIASLPIGIGSKLVPLKALAHVGIEEVNPSIYREDEREVFQIAGRRNKTEPVPESSPLEKAHQLVTQWQADQPKNTNGKVGPILYFEEAEKELNDALRQLTGAIGLSIVLIFLTLVIQFGSLANAMLVLVAVPLGIIGVIASLFIFKSTLSLNSALGVILLNGIAVANSIILVDFLKRLVDQGMSPAQAAVEAGKKRLRPILITSLTTILGMLPIALGTGDGGRILQPLGIAVAGGLWVSMGLTLFVVPALQVSFLEWRLSKKVKRAPQHRNSLAGVATQ